MEFKRIQNEFAAVGLTLKAVYDGVPHFDGSVPKAKEALVDAIMADHIFETEDYLNADLDSVASNVKANANSTEWTAYLGVQTAIIAERKRAELAGTGGLYLDWQKAKENSEPTADAKRTTWLNAVSGIQTLQSKIEVK